MSGFFDGWIWWWKSQNEWRWGWSAQKPEFLERAYFCDLLDYGDDE